jgi:hypothetical protein
MKEIKKEQEHHNFSIGDYVLATKWNDGSSKDDWCIGFFKTFNKDRYYIVDLNGNSLRVNGFRRCKKISKKRGEFILSKIDLIQMSSKSLWFWMRQPIDS